MGKKKSENPKVKKLRKSAQECSKNSHLLHGNNLLNVLIINR
jgi:hypothetical protein